MPACSSRVLCSTTIATKPRTSTTILNDTVQPRQAAMLAIGTANPPNSMSQDEYADWYFRVTNSDHLTNLKHKLKKICRKSGIKKRHFHHGDDTFRDHPELAVHGAPSLDARQDILAAAMPELAAAAAARAIAEWGRPASDVTHLVFTTYSGMRMPGADIRLASLLGLRRSVQRTPMYFVGCHAAAAALRVAKDIAENSPGTARVLVVCAELTLMLFQPAQEHRVDTLVNQALLGDGAGAVIVGAGDAMGGERKVFDMVSAAQTVVPGSEDVADGQVRASGMVFRPSPKLPALVRDNVDQLMAERVVPGGPAILDAVEEGLALAPGKMDASRRVLSEYGNMSGASIIFVLDELRRRGDLPPGGLGVMLGVGPGISIETMVLRAAAA
uniref:Chalcone synthase n=1 Tax=Leersia perrieri TaxID=77586 RepID=A0A0D9XSN3_9ORYZ